VADQRAEEVEQKRLWSEGVQTRANALMEQAWFKSLLITEGVSQDRVNDEFESWLGQQGIQSDLLRLSARVVEQESRLRRYNEHSRGWILAWAGVTIASILVGVWAALASESAWWLLGGVWLLSAVTWVPFLVREHRRKRLHLEMAPADLSHALTDLDRSVRACLEKSVRLATQPVFVPPAQDQVTIGHGAALSSRAIPNQRVGTDSRTVIELHMLRSGGATIGVTGERGTGKSEVLRSFCDRPSPAASIDAGGTIGVFVPVPAAFDGVAFLRLVTRRLIEAVPGYATPQAVRSRNRRLFGALLIIGGIGLAIFGLVGATGGADDMSDLDLGWWLVIGAGAFCYCLGLVFVPRASNLLGKLRTSTDSPNGRSEDASVKPARHEVARNACALMTRIRYAETLTSGKEASLSWGKVGLTRSAQRTLSEIPLSEVDLVAEFADLTESLELVGYRVIVGIDEMDKLAADESLTRFLNTVKLLFSVRSCSFLVSVSTSARGEFLRRGIVDRTVLDSSFDAVEEIAPFNFLETRSLLRHRDAQMSDGQILLCHVLAGGLPRETLRCAQVMARFNFERGGAQRLSTLAELIIDSRFDEALVGLCEEVTNWEDAARTPADQLLAGWNRAWSGRKSSTCNLVWTEGMGLAENKEHALRRLQLLWQFLELVRARFSPPDEPAATPPPLTAADGDQMAKTRRHIQSDIDLAIAELMDLRLASVVPNAADAPSSPDEDVARSVNAAGG
jgi:hypothetical protein